MRGICPVVADDRRINLHHVPSLRFEESVLARLPHCQVYTFDHTVTPKGVPKGVHFLNWGLGKENSGKLRTLETIAYKLGHTPDTSSIEILKIDIEGHEVRFSSNACLCGQSAKRILIYAMVCSLY